MKPLDADEGVVESRRIGLEVVRFADDGRAFILRPVQVKGKLGTRRVYGSTANCEGCEREYFYRGDRPGRFCTIACSKRGDRNPTRRRPQRSQATSCDKLFSRIVRSEGRCVRCGSFSNLQCAHGFSRRYRNVRWDRRNAFCLCRGCHFYFTSRPIEWDNWLRDEWGEELYTEMRMLAVDTQHKPDLDVILAELRAEQEELYGILP